MHGLAIAQANQADLGSYGKARNLLEQENIDPRGQMNWNAGVLFFSLTPELQRLFTTWHDLALRYQALTSSDQVLLNLAMEQEQFNPYALTSAFNYRGYLWIRSPVRIWHHRNPPPPRLNAHPQKMRRVVLGRISYPLPDRPDMLGRVIKVLNQLRHRFRDRPKKR